MAIAEQANIKTQYMTKRDIAEKVAERMQTTPNLAEHFIDAFCMEMRKAMNNGNTVYIREFGTFSPKLRKAKKVQNIHAKTTMDWPATYVPHFKPGKTFLKKMQSVLKPGSSCEEKGSAE